MEIVKSSKYINKCYVLSQLKNLKHCNNMLTYILSALNIDYSFYHTTKIRKIKYDVGLIYDSF
jgi:hypothetical protein